jgi:hypothetical protein
MVQFGGPILHFLCRLAKIFQGLAVDKFDLACRTHRRHDPGMLSTVKRRLCSFDRRASSALSVFDVGVRSEPFDKLSIVV